ncbi:MAG: 2-phosphosulfolactate phosphatase [candidate division Zixibacteria bacterium]|nr:2-phosphosulfolactate phosphatase [candidate division Zixibacteria bacterium]
MHVDLFLTPIPFEKSSFENRTVVVIDVLRATTSICAALKAKAKGVIPADGPGEAGDLRSKLGSDIAVLAGERNGVKIDNFTLGNSPAEFTEASVGGKFVIMTTTNGTPVFGRTHSAKLVIACALVNLSVVATKIAEEDCDVTIVCSGREGSFSIEDTICGGILLHQLQVVHKKEFRTNDAGSLAQLLYRSNKTAIRPTIQQGEHARFLTSIGFGGDVEIATDIDSIPVLPILRDGRLVLEQSVSLLDAV